MSLSSIKEILDAWFGRRRRTYAAMIRARAAAIDAYTKARKGQRTAAYLRSRSATTQLLTMELGR